MTEEEYWARIKAIPLVRERESSDGEAVMCRAQDGTPVRVTKPNQFREDEREAVVTAYERWYSPRYN